MWVIKMSNKGFTLIEMLAAGIIVLLISMIAMPMIINQINDRKEEISDITLNTIYSATNLYLDDYQIISNLNVGDNYCVSLDKLVNEGYLEYPIKDAVSKEDIPLTKYVKTTVNANLEFYNFELTDTSC